MHNHGGRDAVRRLASKDEVREHLERKRRSAISEHAWGFVCEFHFDTVNALMKRATDDPEFEHAAEYAETIIRRLASPDGQRGSAPVARPQDLTPRASGVNRSLAVSAMCALHARALPDVIDFRRDALGDEILPIDDVPAWIKRQGEDEPYPPVDRHEAVGGGRRRFPPLMSYPSPSGWAELIRVGEGTLGRLSGLASILVDLYGWSEPNAVGFVLTDLIPRVGMRSATQIKCKWTVTLTIPYWTSAANVADAYLRGRRELLDSGLPELRPLTEKSAALVLFVVQTLDTNGQPRQGWPCVWREWNERHPQWTFPNAQSLNSQYRRLARTVWPLRPGNTPANPRRDGIETLLEPGH